MAFTAVTPPCRVTSSIMTNPWSLMAIVHHGKSSKHRTYHPATMYVSLLVPQEPSIKRGFRTPLQSHQNGDPRSVLMRCIDCALQSTIQDCGNQNEVKVMPMPWFHAGSKQLHTQNLWATCLPPAFWCLFRNRFQCFVNSPALKRSTISIVQSSELSWSVPADLK